MPVYVYAIVNAVLAASILAGIVGLLVWSVLTQHRQPGCEDIRLRLGRPRAAVRRRQPRPLATEDAELPAQELVLS